jgi:hypothetical protein
MNTLELGSTGENISRDRTFIATKGAGRIRDTDAVWPAGSDVANYAGHLAVTRAAARFPAAAAHPRGGPVLSRITSVVASSM